MSRPGILKEKLRNFLCDESGSAAIEYGLIASLIGVMMITGARAIGGELDDKFVSIASILEGPSEPAVSSDSSRTLK